MMFGFVFHTLDIVSGTDEEAYRMIFSALGPLYSVLLLLLFPA